MPKTREAKSKIINELKKEVAEQKAMVFVDFSGVETKKVNELKSLLKAEGAIFKVVKKTLLRLALSELFPQLAQKIEDLRGQLAVVFAKKDEISPIKIIDRFIKTHQKLKFLGAFFEKSFQDEAKVLQIAQLPSRQELLGRVVGSFSSPLNNFVYVLKANLSSLVFCLEQIKNKKGQNQN
jgi:large subunit ribosomal protein L10